jgi:hypothetical protein
MKMHVIDRLAPRTRGVPGMGRQMSVSMPSNRTRTLRAYSRGKRLCCQRVGL